MLPFDNIAAFIFDMDGLVLDTEPAYHAAWNAAIKQMAYAIDPDQIKGLSGLSYQDVLAKLRSWYGDDFNQQDFARLSAEIWRAHVEINGIKVNKGVDMLLALAVRHDIPVALATNSSAVYAQKCLQIAGIAEAFPIKVTANDVKSLKPAPDIFLLAAERLQVNIAECVVFEDSYPGIAAANAAGACAVYVPSVVPASSAAIELCDVMLDDLSQFLPYLSEQRV